MPDLSPLIAQYLHRFLVDIDDLNRGGSKVDPKPHKLLMLLSIIDIVEKGHMTENKIYYDEKLRETFKDFFQLIYDSSDWCQPAPPFFHLRTANFWNHKILDGRETQYAKLTTSGGGHKRIKENIEYAYFSDYAYAVVQNPVARRLLQAHISELLNPNQSP